MKHYWTVTIPYYHRFTVVAEDEQEAISVAHDEDGVIVGYDDNDAEVELADEVFGGPPIEIVSPHGCTPSAKHPGRCAECGEPMEARVED